MKRTQIAATLALSAALLMGCGEDTMGRFHENAARAGIPTETADGLARELCKLDAGEIVRVARRAFESQNMTQIDLLLLLAGDGVDAHCPARRAEFSKTPLRAELAP